MQLIQIYMIPHVLCQYKLDGHERQLSNVTMTMMTTIMTVSIMIIIVKTIIVIVIMIKGG